MAALLLMKIIYLFFQTDNAFLKRKEFIMVTQKEIDRINELYRKAKEKGLTEAEAQEQKTLRAEYISAFKNNLRGTLDTIKIQYPDGTLVDVKERHENRVREQYEKSVKEGN